MAADVLFLCVYVVRVGAQWDMGRDGTAGTMKFQGSNPNSRVPVWSLAPHQPPSTCKPGWELITTHTASPLQCSHPTEKALNSWSPVTPLFITDTYIPSSNFLIPFPPWFFSIDLQPSSILWILFVLFGLSPFTIIWVPRRKGFFFFFTTEA